MYNVPVDDKVIWALLAELSLAIQARDVCDPLLSPTSSSFTTTPSKVEQRGVFALIGTPTGSVQSFLS